LFAFGIGSSVNRDLIEATARAGRGEPTIVATTSEAASAAKRFLKYISNPVLTKIRVEAEGVTLGKIEPAGFGDVFASRPLVINGTWSGEHSGAIILRGIGGDGAPFEKKIDLAACRT
jgi:Ca-activated chloride channel family protein